MQYNMDNKPYLHSGYFPLMGGGKLESSDNVMLLCSRLQVARIIIGNMADCHNFKTS